MGLNINYSIFDNFFTKSFHTQEVMLTFQASSKLKHSFSPCSKTQITRNLSSKTLGGKIARFSRKNKEAKESFESNKSIKSTN